jgi:putative sporulation protein YyaC
VRQAREKRAWVQGDFQRKKTKLHKKSKVFLIEQGKRGNNFPMENLSKKQIVVVCFGTPSVSGDALGPKIGTLLTDKFNLPCFVYGNQTSPVTAKNKDEYIAFVEQVHRGATIIAVDASLGKEDKIGCFTVREDGVCPAGVKGEKARFGHVGILGVVGKSGKDNMLTLLSVSEDKVSKLAYKIAFVIKTAVEAVFWSA